jgi:leader peptidase (prepilin peptidase) / N-methyltransferase
VGRVLLASAASVAGALLVGPALTHAVLRWIGWRGVVPLLLGWEPSRAAIGSPAAWGRYRRRGEPTDRWALGIMVATGVGFGTAAARFGWSINLVPVLVLVAGLVAASTVDLVCRRIPTSFVYVTAAGVAAALGVAVLVEHEAVSLLGALVGAATCWGLLGLQYLVALALAGGNFGLGDVRLGAVIGLVLGWLGWIGWPSGDPYPGLGSVATTLTGLIAAGLTAVIAGLTLWVARGRREPYPFGPWLSVGGFVAALLMA